MRVEQVLERTLKESFREHGLPSCVLLRLENIHSRGFHNFNWQFIPEGDCLDAEDMLATPLLAELESMTAKPRAGGGSKDGFINLLIPQHPLNPS